MKLIQFIYIYFFVQLGFSQDFRNEKLTDTIIINNNFINQLDDNYIKKSGFSHTSPVDFKIDSTTIIFKNRKTNPIKIHLLFHNQTESLIIIDKIKAWNNYIPNKYKLILLPNKQETIEIASLFYKIKNLSNHLRFNINKPEKKITVYQRHNFEFIGK